MRRGWLALLLVGCTCDSQPGREREPARAPDEPASVDEPANASAPSEPEPASDEPNGREPERAREAAAAVREGRRRAQAGDLEGALRAFDRALEQLPGAPRIRCETGYVAYRAGHVERAARELDRALAMLPAPDHASEELRVPLAMCLYNRGRVHEEAGQPERAAARYRASLSLRPHRAVRSRLRGLGDAVDAAATRPPPTAAEPAVLRWARPSLCGSADATAARATCPGAGATEVHAGAEEGSRAEGAFVIATTTRACAMDYTGRHLALRTASGWWRARLCTGAHSRGDDRVTYHASCDVELTRPHRDVVVARLDRWTDEHYEDAAPVPHDVDAACVESREGERASAAYVVCRADTAPPRCGRLEAGAAESVAVDLWCDEELPGWVEAHYRGHDVSLSDEVSRTHTLRFEGRTAVVERAEGVEAPPGSGRLSLDALFRHLAPVDVR